jgi:hypothetical protein
MDFDHRAAAKTINEIGMLLTVLRTSAKNGKSPKIVIQKIKEATRSLERLRDELDEWEGGDAQSPYF